MPDKFRKSTFYSLPPPSAMQFWLDESEKEMRIRNYSPKTIKNYLRCLKEYFGQLTTDICCFNEEFLRSFLLKKHKENYASQTVNLYLNAVLFFYRAVLKQPVKSNIKFAKRPGRLPIILSREEIQKILDTIINFKHKILIALAYGAGLRVSEVVSLKIFDLDFPKSLIYIKQGKGSRDRNTLLPQKLHTSLKALCENRPPNSYVFESNRGEKLTARTAQKIFDNALRKAKIIKPATFHSLRHSFATHLIEQDINLRYVQELLGHKNIRTTQIYTQVTNSHLQNIKSPL